MPVQTRFGVLAYGERPRLHAECHGAMLSLMAHAPSGAEYVVMTDSPDRYRWLGDSVRIEHLSETTLEAWRGPANDRYRPKIEALRQLAGAGTANIVLVDTDTLTRRDLGPLVGELSRGRFLLYRREYPLSAPPRRGDRMLRHEILGRSWDGITPTPQTAMWNGGVIGCAREHVGVLHQVVAVFDQMRAASRHFAIEQLAYSVVFEAHGTIVEAAPWIDHYWANREFFSRAVEHEIVTLLMTAMTPREAAAHLRDHPISGPLDGRATGWRRIVKKMTESGRADG